MGKLVTLGPAIWGATIVAQIAANGRAVIAWTTQDAGIQFDQANRLRAAFRSRGRPFGPAQLVHVGNAVDPDDGQPLDLRLAVAPDGRALLEWSDITGSYARGGFQYPIRVAEASPGGRFGRSRRLASDAGVGDVALAGDGTAAAAWGGKGGVRVALHAPGAPFGHSQHVDRPGPLAPFSAVGEGLVSCSGQGGWISRSSRMRRWVLVRRSRRMPAWV